MSKILVATLTMGFALSGFVHADDAGSNSQFFYQAESGKMLLVPEVGYTSGSSSFKNSSTSIIPLQ